MAAEQLGGFHVEMRQISQSANQALGGAHNASGVPHQSLHFSALPLGPFMLNHAHCPWRRLLKIRSIGTSSRQDLGSSINSCEGLQVGDTCFSCPGPKHEAFQKTVGSEPICAMQSSTGDLTGGKETHEACFSREAGLHSATHVVLGRNHRYGVFTDVDPRFQALRSDVRKVVQNLVPGLVGNVKPDMRVSSGFHLVVNGARHNVAWRQLQAVIVLGHEPFALQVQQVATLSADGFGNQEAHRRSARVVQPCRVKLDKLHVGNGSVCPVCHGNAISGGHRGVGRVGIHLTAAAAGQKRHRCTETQQFHLLLIQDIHPGTDLAVAGLTGDEIDCQVMLVEVDGRMRAGLRKKRSFDLESSHVGSVHDPPVGMPPLTGKVQSAIFVLGKLGANLHELQDVLSSLGADNFNSTDVVQIGSSCDGVLDVFVHGIMRVQDSTDATLRVARAAFVRLVLGDDGDASMVRDIDGVREPRNAASDDDEVIVHWRNIAIPCQPRRAVLKPRNGSHDLAALCAALCARPA
mmetsp:Transcript_26766/g.69375  ORF Transcript_26766/g.69375 Transcript_26766/m.69375 type:complete len:520 (+) Transcript_26766:504-2063(+)